MSVSKIPQGEGQKPGNESPESIQAQGQRMLRRLGRSFYASWKMYKHSKTGLVGLGIVIGFLVMAIFAPFLTPYSTEFRAPATDIFIADHASGNLTEKLNWTSIMGLSETSDVTLKRIMVYSKEGVTDVFPVSVGTSQNIVLGTPTRAQLPPSATYLQFVQFQTPFFFILQGKTLHEYTDILSDTGVSYQLPFVPLHFSNLWDGYTPIVRQGRIALAMCNETSVWLIDKRPDIPEAGQLAETWTSTVNITGAKIVGSPLVTDGDFAGGGMVVLPTDKGMMALTVQKTVSGLLVPYVSNVVLGGVRWQSNYSYTLNNQTVDFNPVISENMMTFPDLPNPVDPFNTRTIILATQTNKVVSYNRDNGSIVWVTDISMPKLRDFTVQDLYPTPSGVLAIGRTGTQGFMAGIDPASGRVLNNFTKYTTFAGSPDSPPRFVVGTDVYLLSTDLGIYLFGGGLQLNATFTAPQGGAVTPASYMGNIYIAGANTGNYWGVVTKQNTLFVETLYGVDIAPLPPGTYASGHRYILGTDYEGHDILTWLMYGTRAELMVGVTAAFFAVVVGTIAGLVAGYYTGLVDDILMRTTDVFLALPGLVIILLFAAVFGPSLPNIIIIIAILSWPGIARVIRSVTLSLKERAFVDAARVAGASESRLIFRHIAPNVLGYTFLYMTFTISGAIVTEAILAFLGFGDVNYVTWGMMLQYLQISGHTLNAPWWLLPPGAAITLLCLSFYLIGRAFDEVVNPRLRRR